MSRWVFWLVPKTLACVLTYALISSVLIWNYHNHENTRGGAKTPNTADSDPKGLNLIIWTQKRSGSNFLSSLIEGHPSSIIFFEPIRHIVGEDADNLTAVVSHLKALCNCNVSAFFRSFLEKGIGWAFPDLYPCNEMLSSCLDFFYHKMFCLAAKLRIIKLVSPKLSAAIPLLQNISPKTKVVHLVRDPRGIFPSRQHLLSIKSVTQRDVNLTVLCQTLREDLQAAKELQKIFPRQYLMVRYEDLSLHTETIIRQVFLFLKVSYTVSVHKRIMDITTGLLSWRSEDIPSEFEVSKNSVATAFQWRNKSKWETTRSIQKECYDVIQNLGFRVFANKREYLDHNLSVFQ